jgi:hypothetical protein
MTWTTLGWSAAKVVRQAKKERAAQRARPQSPHRVVCVARDDAGEETSEASGIADLEIAGRNLDFAADGLLRQRKLRP